MSYRQKKQTEKKSFYEKIAFGVTDEMLKRAYSFNLTNSSGGFAGDTSSINLSLGGYTGSDPGMPPQIGNLFTTSGAPTSQANPAPSAPVTPNGASSKPTTPVRPNIAGNPALPPTTPRPTSAGTNRSMHVPPQGKTPTPQRTRAVPVANKPQPSVAGQNQAIPATPQNGLQYSENGYVPQTKDPNFSPQSFDKEQSYLDASLRNGAISQYEYNTRKKRLGEAKISWERNSAFSQLDNIFSRLSEREKEAFLSDDYSLTQGNHLLPIYFREWQQAKRRSLQSQPSSVTPSADPGSRNFNADVAIATAPNPNNNIEAEDASIRAQRRIGAQSWGEKQDRLREQKEQEAAMEIQRQQESAARATKNWDDSYYAKYGIDDDGQPIPRDEWDRKTLKERNDIAHRRIAARSLQEDILRRESARTPADWDRTFEDFKQKYITPAMWTNALKRTNGNQTAAEKLVTEFAKKQMIKQYGDRPMEPVTGTLGSN